MKRKHSLKNRVSSKDTFNLFKGVEMKKLLVLTLLVTGLAQATKIGYDIVVKNDTDGNVKVEITAPYFCPNSNGGDTLTPGKVDSWPTHNWCYNSVKLTYPDGSTAKITASQDNNAFRAYKNKQGEYHYDHYTPEELQRLFPGLFRSQ